MSVLIKGELSKALTAHAFLFVSQIARKISCLGVPLSVFTPAYLLEV